MATQEPPLDEIQWRHPALAQEMQGIHSNSVLFYFGASPFFDHQSNNSILYVQGMSNMNMHYLVQTREAFEGRLRTMSGLEFMVAQEPADMVTGTGVWVIRKQTRSSGEVTAIHATYFVVGENVYLAPSVADILGSRMLSILDQLNKFFTTAAALPIYSPAQGTRYMLPPSKSTNATGQGIGQASKENTPLPDSLQSMKKPSLPSSRTNAFRANNLLRETLDITLKHGDEFMDENPITGEPGAFHLSGTGRKDKDKVAAPGPGLGKISLLPKSDVTSKAATPALTAIDTSVEPAKKAKGEKTPIKGQPGKLKRKKSKVLGNMSGGVSPI